MKHRRQRAALVALLLLTLAASACSQSTNMYRHNRSHCDCPTF